jgi:hypothetical protein
MALFALFAPAGLEGRLHSARPSQPIKASLVQPPSTLAYLTIKSSRHSRNLPQESRFGDESARRWDNAVRTAVSPITIVTAFPLFSFCRWLTQ